MSAQNCRIGKIRFWINGKEYWAFDIAQVLRMKRALDPNYGVRVVKPGHQWPIALWHTKQFFIIRTPHLDS